MTLCSHASAANLPFGGQPQAGIISSAAQSNSYTFAASAKDVIDLTMAVTSGKLIPKIRLYNPDGKQLSGTYSGAPFACSGSTLELNNIKLPATGTYTVLIGDCADFFHLFRIRRTDHRAYGSIAAAPTTRGSPRFHQLSEMFVQWSSCHWDILEFTR